MKIEEIINKIQLFKNTRCCEIEKHKLRMEIIDNELKDFIGVCFSEPINIEDTVIMINKIM